MIIRDFIIKEHRVLTEAQARAQLMEDPVFRHARQFGQLLVEYNLTKAQVQQLFKDPAPEIWLHRKLVVCLQQIKTNTPWKL